MVRIRRLCVWVSVLAVLLAITGCGSPAQEVVSETPVLSRPGLAVATPFGGNAASQATATSAASMPTRPSGDAASHVAAGQAALDAGDFTKAEQEYLDAAALDPNLARAQFGLGNVYVRLGRLQDAETRFKNALALDPTMTSAQANLGVVYYQMGQLTQAETAFEAALRAEPNDAATLYLLAAVRLQQNNLAEAETLLLKARDINPDLPEVYYGLGVLYRLKGQKDDAIQAFEKFLAIGPGQDPSAMDYARQELKQLQGQ